MSNPNNCLTCDYKAYPDGGWCYMFAHEPQSVCLSHTARRLPLADLIKSLNAINPNPPETDMRVLP